jgi:hypothetical protein
LTLLPIPPIIRAPARTYPINNHQLQHARSDNEKRRAG